MIDEILNLWLASAMVPQSFKLDILLCSNLESYYGELKNCIGLSQKSKKGTYYKTLLDSFDDEELKEKLHGLKKQGIELISFKSPSYPEKLRNIENPPAYIFVKGNIAPTNLKCVSIVGSRECSYYGEEAARFITKQLAIEGIGIISGLARGIDSVAHKVALDNNGFTAAVLGCGVDKVYPRESKKLYESIGEKGALISEFPPGTPPISSNFPQRNRIISALSDLTVVVEAGEKSGSIITATRAMEQGKEVIAVPGSIFSHRNTGTHALIRDGAYIFTNMEELFSLLGHRARNIIKKGESIEKLTDKEKCIYELIDDNPIHIDEIIKRTNIDIKYLYEVLFELQLKKEIRCISGNYYVKIHEFQ